jgi:hypothetical protein
MGEIWPLNHNDHTNAVPTIYFNANLADEISISRKVLRLTTSIKAQRMTANRPSRRNVHGAAIGPRHPEVVPEI